MGDVTTGWRSSSTSPCVMRMGSLGGPPRWKRCRRYNHSVPHFVESPRIRSANPGRCEESSGGSPDVLCLRGCPERILNGSFRQCSNTSRLMPDNVHIQPRQSDAEHSFMRNRHVGDKRFLSPSNPFCHVNQSLRRTVSNHGVPIKRRVLGFVKRHNRRRSLGATSP